LKKFKRLIGQKIRNRRLELGFDNQDDFAHKIDPELNRENISRWERGVHLPQEKFHKKLFEVLKTDESILDIDESDFQRSQLLGNILVKLPTLYNDELELASLFLDKVKIARPLDSSGIQRVLGEILNTKKKNKG
jgi:hypothetical protein